MNSPTRLLFLRHAEVEDQYQRVFGGRIDMDLSTRGRAQADTLASYLLRKFPLDALYASPMRRVHQTLAPLLARVPLQPIVLDGLREVDFGAWTGLRWDQIHEQFGVTAFEWLGCLEQGLVPDAESADRFRARVDEVLERILAAHQGTTVGIACHGGVIRMALALLLRSPISIMGRIEIDYASVTWVDCLGPRREMQLHNFAPWRDL